MGGAQGILNDPAEDLRFRKRHLQGKCFDRGEFEDLPTPHYEAMAGTPKGACADAGEAGGAEPVLAE